MEAKVYRAFLRLMMSLPHTRRGPRRQFDDRWIIMVYLWAVINDRPVSWTCDEQNWPDELLDRPLPSNATMSRRLRTLGVLQLLEQLLQTLSDLTPVPLVKTLDSKPLYVGAYSKDRDAKRGRVGAGLFARGYRLHALCHGRAVRWWTLAPMNQHDAGMAHQLVAPPRRVNRHKRDIKYNRPERLRALDLLASPLEKCGQANRFGIGLYNCREAVESSFGELTMRGLNYLPTWIRGPRRVALWTAGKIAIHLWRGGQRKGLMPSDAKS